MEEQEQLLLQKIEELKQEQILLREQLKTDVLTQQQFEDALRKIIAEEKKLQEELELEEKKTQEEESQELLNEEESQELLNEEGLPVFNQVQLVDKDGELIHSKNYSQGLFFQNFIIIFLLIILVFKRR